MRIARLIALMTALVLWGAGVQAQTTTDPDATTSEAPADTAVADAAAASTTPTGPDEVIVGVYINDIQQLDLQTHSYAMDFYVWLRWTNPEIDPSLTLEYMNPFQLWGHIATPLYDGPQDLPDGTKYMAFRYQGQFNSKLPLEKYPFDDQSLIVEFEDNAAGISTQIYVPDKNPVSMNPDMTLPGYIFGPPTLTIVEKPYPTNFGDTSVATAEPYSHVTFAVPVHRPALTYAIKIILPIFLIVVCAALVFFIHPTFVEGRIGMGITALLTLVALQLTTNSQLPEVDYLMMIDMLYFAAYIYVVISLAQVVRTSWSAHEGNTDKAVTQDRFAFVVATGAYVLFTAAILILSLI
ncbi:MAG: hypothetical protein ACRCS3_03670 [Paracoccaceae bacterium]